MSFDTLDANERNVRTSFADLSPLRLIKKEEYVEIYVFFYRINDIIIHIVLVRGPNISK